jgi:hypothetical protein
MLHCMYITCLVYYTRWTGYLTRLAEKKDAYGALVGKPGGKKPLGRLKCKWKDNSKWTLKKECNEGARTGLLWVSTCSSGGPVTNCRFPRKAHNVLHSSATSKHLAVGRCLRPTPLGAPGLAPLRVRQLKLLAPALVPQTHDL